MWVIISSDDLVNGVQTKVDKNKIYTLIRNEGQIKKVLRGSSLYSLILSEKKSGKFTLSNACYNLKGAYYISSLYTDGRVMGLTDLRFKSSSIFSNYFECKINYDNRVYNSSEAVYQSMKTLDKNVRDKFINLSPDDAKYLGRQIQASSDLRSDWWRVQYRLMTDIVKTKFSQHPELFVELKKTAGYYLIEDTTGWHDRIWGKCYCHDCNGVGWNYLGSILTHLRLYLIGI